MLKKIQRNERNKTHLSKISGNFYNDATCYFNKLDEEMVPQTNFRKYKNSISACYEIIERRLYKITNNAYFTSVRNNQLTSSRNDNPELPLNMLKVEEKIFWQLLNIYNDFYRENGLKQEGKFK